MGAGALTICHNKAAVQIKEDMKKMITLPILRLQQDQPAMEGGRVFGVSLVKLEEMGLVKDGVPLVVRSMVDYLREHALKQEGLFRVSGCVRAVEELKHRLDGGEDVDFLQDGDSCTVASLLKLYLRELPDGLIYCSLRPALLQLYQECGADGFCRDLRDLLQKLPDGHYSLLRYLCHFLTQVEKQHVYNRMTALNLATVFGPNVFHVSPGIDGIQEQMVYNKIMAKLIQHCGLIFQTDKDHGFPKEDTVHIIRVKEADMNSINLENSACTATLERNTSALRKKKVKKGKSEVDLRSMPQPAQSAGLPLSRHLTESPRTRIQLKQNQTSSPRPQNMEQASKSTDPLSSSTDGDRPISPLYMSSHLLPRHCRPDLTDFLERTIRSTVEEHLFDVPMQADVSGDGPEAAGRPTARQRRRQHREGDDALRQNDGRDSMDKENIPSSRMSVGEDAERRQTHAPKECWRLQKAKHSPTLAELTDNQASLSFKESSGTPRTQDRSTSDDMESTENGDDGQKDTNSAHLPTCAMKIQESLSGSEPSDSCEDVPRLDLSTLTEENNWGEPVPDDSWWQRDSMDREEARLSPHAGGQQIRQLLEGDTDPMLSPRFYAYGQSQQFLDDTEVPPSPPNAHSFVSRRRSSSLGSCDDGREELTSAQLSKKIHSLKRKIRKFEEKFEEERKYRPSHSDKAANPEVLRWMNELAKLRKDLKEHKLMKSEEDLTPAPRQRSNTLPKSFGSQLEKKSPEARAPKPPVESTLEAVMNKLKEKRDEDGRPEDIKDMTREQIGAEKVALQKALLYYESIHGRPVTKSERQIMKPLYDRYRLVKQILCRASTIPVIGSPSSKRRGPLLQPIIEGVPALFFDNAKEEEDGSDDENDNRAQFTVTVKPELSMLSLLEQLEDDVEGFISPVDELSPSKNTTDMRLSNLHAATMQELVEQLQEAREEKKRIRKNLREFEDQFFRQNGRNVQKEDRSPLAVEYNEYKHVKAKLRLLEVLISKRDSSKFI